MGLLRLAVLGPAEVYQDGSRLAFALRKAQALLLYLAVEGGLHSRSKLAALLWPDSEAADARRTLRNALGLLRSLLADPNPTTAPDSLSSGQGVHLLSQGELIGLNPQAPLELDLALVRGPFLDGFWLREETAFNEWHEQQQRQWQVRLQLLCERLSSWQEAGGGLQQAHAPLTPRLQLYPLAEQAPHPPIPLPPALGNPPPPLP